jgi:hypothetical protein
VSARPTSYATPAAARAYTARVLARPAPTGPARVYLIYSPKLRTSPGTWAALLPAITASLRGAELLEYPDLFGKSGAPPVEERVPRIIAETHGALVIPFTWRRPASPVRHLLGYPAAAEARALVSAGVPVLVLTPTGLAAWPDVRARAAADPHPPYLTLELDLPDLPPRPLPTVVASMRALGLRATNTRAAPAPSRPRADPDASFEEARPPAEDSR